MAKGKGQKNAGNKPKQDTSSTTTVAVTQTTEETNEEKPPTPVQEGLAIGNRKLQLQMQREAKEAKEEEERIKAAKEKAKQESKSNSAKKKNKNTSRQQNVNELKHEPQLPKEEKYIFDKAVTEPKAQSQRNSNSEFKTQSKMETVDQKYKVNKPEEINSDTDHSWQESAPISINRNLTYDSSFDTKYDNPEPSTRRSYGSRENSYQNPNHSWGEITTQNESTFKKRPSNDYNQRRSYNNEGNYPRDNRGRGDNNYRDGAKSRISEPNYGRPDNYSNFANRGSNYNNRGGFRQSLGRFEGKSDVEFQEFLDRAMQRNPIKYGKLSEVKGDLFTASEDYSLAHCVAEDMSMGAGIAKTFRSKFGRVGFLLNQRQKTGGLAVLEDKSRYIYYLITKEQSRGKPTLYTLWMSLNKLKIHVEENNINKLAIPQIGCGLDRLDWRTVQQMLEHIFKDIDIEIVVYIWDENAEETTSTPPQKLLKKCAVIHSQMKLTDIEKGTGLVYFGSIDGYETEGFKNLSDKYNITAGYRAQKVLTDVIRSIDGSEYIYGLITKTHFKNENDFEDIEKTLRNLSKLLKKDKTYYIGFEAFVDETDKIIVDKIVALMQYALLDIEIWVCWPDALKEFCPQQYKSYY